MIAMGFEQWADAQPAIARLCGQHWKEIAGNQDCIPLDPNWETYATLADAGKVKLLTVRDDGRLVGYMIVFIWGHLHYKSTLHAAEDIYFLLPEYRRGMLGVRMFKTMLVELKRIGVVKAHFSHKVWFEGGGVGKVLQRLGGKLAEEIYIFMLQEI